jgi:hypothetical protein
MNYPTLQQLDLISFEAVERALGGLNASLIADGLPEQAAGVMVDLVALSAAELEVVFAPADAGLQPLPLRVAPSRFPLALLKTDTTLTQRCQTSDRLLQGRARLQDVFLFTADLDKFTSLFPSLELPELAQNYQSILETFMNELMATETARALGIVDLLRRTPFMVLSACIWRLRLGTVMLPGKDLSIEIVDDLARHWHLLGGR